MSMAETNNIMLKVKRNIKNKKKKKIIDILYIIVYNK